MNQIDNYIYDLDDDNVDNVNLPKIQKTSSALSISELTDELTISGTCMTDFNRVSRSTQTTINEIVDLKNVKTEYKNLNRNLKTVYGAITMGYNKKVNESVLELHNSIIQQLLQIEKAYKQNVNTIRQAYHTELINFKIQFKNRQDESLKSAHDKQLTKILSEKQFYIDENAKLKKLVNDQSSKIFRLKYILVQKYPGKVKQLFSDKNNDINDILDPRDLQVESAMQHLQIEKLKKDNEIRILKKKLIKMNKELNSKLEDESEFISIAKHKNIINKMQEEFEVNKSKIEQEKNREIERLYVESKKLKSIYEAQLLSLRKMQNKTNIGHVLERQNKILELSRMFLPRIVNQNPTLSSSQIDTKDEDNSIYNSNSNIFKKNDNIDESVNNTILTKINKNIYIMEKENSILLKSSNNKNISVRPFSSYFPSEFVRKKK
ncbi:hypothetical protein U3516DRAFT_638071 [Neocallimastix sp. 'constans']